MADTVTYRLSTIDQSFIRTYHRVCLCFPCDNDGNVRQRVADILTAGMKRTASHMPILAGAVHPCSALTTSSPSDVDQTWPKDLARDEIDGACMKTTENGGTAQLDASRRRTSIGRDRGVDHGGRLEVRVSTNSVSSMKAVMKGFAEQEFSATFSELTHEGMPASVFVDTALTPLPDMPDPANGSNPVFAIQANFIDGGVLVALYLHHSVVDIVGAASVIRHLSISEEVLSERQISITSLQEDSLEQSRMRDRLSGSRGVKASAVEHPEYHSITGAARRQKPRLAPSVGACHILSFDMAMLNDIRSMVTERIHTMHDRPEVDVSTKDCLSAILWKAVTRARWLSNDEGNGQPSSMLMPVNIRERVEPALDAEYYGNATLYAHSTAPIVQLCLPFDVGTISRISQLVHTSTVRTTETKVRSAIALINQREEVRSVNHPGMDFGSDVFIMEDWSGVPVGHEAGLGLGLGGPEYVRKTSRQHSSYGCVLLPMKHEQGVWEVLVQMTDEAMEELLDDPGLQLLLRRVA